MSEARLPKLDSCYLLEAADAEELQAFAEGLWQHLQAVRGGAPNNGYTLQDIRRGVSWLLERHTEQAVPLSGPALNVTQALIGARPVGRHTPVGVNEASIDDYWTAILFESKQPIDPQGENPSAASLRSIAKHVVEQGGFIGKVGGKFVPGDYRIREGAKDLKRWRKLQHYHDNVRLYRQCN